ncbi:MAG: hypothetical protein K8M05_39685 [Deltaproteobacteria bacterium]|nr:hypothetical protein [Kofleriaceae bacterium]
MALVIDHPYSRADIAAELHTGASDTHAVLLRLGKAVAVVVNESGRNPYNNKQYVNTLTASSFTMQGENDDRGAFLEDPENILHLFLRRNGEAAYRYEGRVRFKPPVTEWATRVFDRVP